MEGKDPDNKFDPQKEAFVTTLVDKNDLPGVFAWVKALKNTETIRKIVVTFTKQSQITQQQISGLEKLGALTILVESIGESENGSRNIDGRRRGGEGSGGGSSSDENEIQQNKSSKENLTKLNAFKLTQFNKIVLMDADTLAIRKIDFLFSFPSPSCVADFFKTKQSKSFLNSGVMVLNPSLQTFEELSNMIEIKKYSSVSFHFLSLSLSSFFFFFRSFYFFPFLLLLFLSIFKLSYSFFNFLLSPK